MSSNAIYPGATPPPPGVVPNLQNPQDTGGRTINLAVAIASYAIITFSFAARTYAKWKFSPNYRTEDCLFAVSLEVGAALTFQATTLLYTSCVVAMYYYGEGFHSWDLSPEDYREYKRWLYASALAYWPAGYFTKVTLLLLTARVFSVKRYVGWGIYGFIAGITACYITLQVIKVMLCLPVQSYYDPAVEPRFCFDQRRVFTVDLALSIITDFVILVVPIPLAWSLRVGWRKKLKISTLLGAGGAATAVGAYRAYLVVTTTDFSDSTANFVMLTILTMTELTIGFSCACVPPIHLLLESRRAASKQPRNVLRTRKTHGNGTESLSKGSILATTTRTGGAWPATTQLRRGGDDPDAIIGPSNNSHDIELGQPRATRGDDDDGLETLPWGCRSPRPSITSADGRAEGWLSHDVTPQPAPSPTKLLPLTATSAIPLASQQTTPPPARPRTIFVLQSLLRWVRAGSQDNTTAPMGGITRTVEISLERSDAAGMMPSPPPATAASSSASAVSASVVAGMTRAAYNGRARIIPDRVWDGKTEEYGFQAYAGPSGSGGG